MKTRRCGESVRVLDSENCPDLLKHDYIEDVKPSHTPTPFYVARLKAVGNLPEAFEVENEGRSICRASSEADAAYIVRAVNAHKGFVSLLTRIVQQAESTPKKEVVEISTAQIGEAAQLLIALAQAEGK